MKKRFFLYLVLSLTVLIGWGQHRPKISLLTVTPTSAKFKAEGGSTNFEITTTEKWLIESESPSWVHITRNQNKVTLRVDENTGTSLRKNSFVLKLVGYDKSVRVTFEQEGVKVLYVSPEHLNFKASGETKTVTISSNGTWKLDSNTLSWAHTTQSGNVISIRTDKNNATTSRSGNISVKMGNKEKTIHITQSGAPAKASPTKTPEIALSVSSETVQFDSLEGTKTISVESNSSWQVGSNNSSWAHITLRGNGVDVKVDSNPTSKSRSDWFDIKSGAVVKRVKVSQSGTTAIVPDLSVSPENILFNSFEETKTIKISSKESWYIGTNIASWGHLSQSGNDLIVKVDKNVSRDSRKDWFTIKTANAEKMIKITQEGMPAYLSVSTDSLHFDSHEGSQMISVNTNLEWDISRQTAGWGHLYKKGNTLSVSVDKNTMSEPRSDYFRIKSEDNEVTVNVFQDGNPNIRTFNQLYDNCMWGISVGYVLKQWEYNLAGNIWKTGPFDDDNMLRGIQAGVRFAPQFWYGIGINTGLFYEYCWEANWGAYVNNVSYNRSYKEHGIYIPLHLKYTLNFNEWFQFSLYGGLGLNYVISGKAYLQNDNEYKKWDVFYEDRDWHRLNFMLEYGASFKVKSFQIDISRSKGITNWAGIKDYRLKVGRPLAVSLTYFFF